MRVNHEQKELEGWMRATLLVYTEDFVHFLRSTVSTSTKDEGQLLYCGNSLSNFYLPLTFPHPDRVLKSLVSNVIELEDFDYVYGVKCARLKSINRVETNDWDPPVPKKDRIFIYINGNTYLFDTYLFGGKKFCSVDMDYSKDIKFKKEETTSFYMGPEETLIVLGKKGTSQ